LSIEVHRRERGDLVKRDLEWSGVKTAGVVVVVVSIKSEGPMTQAYTIREQTVSFRLRIPDDSIEVEHWIPI